MTPKAMGKITLFEFEQMAERFQKAAMIIRESQSLLTGAQLQPAPAAKSPYPDYSAKSAGLSGVNLSTPERADYEADRKKRLADQKAFLATQAHRRNELLGQRKPVQETIELDIEQEGVTQ